MRSFRYSTSIWLGNDESLPSEFSESPRAMNPKWATQQIALRKSLGLDTVKTPKPATNSRTETTPSVPKDIKPKKHPTQKPPPNQRASPGPIKRPYVPKLEPNRPFSLPPGEFKPKQSLGQNYLSDQNTVDKIINAFEVHRQEHFLEYPDETPDIHGQRVVEIGPGLGALSRVLHPRYPQMTAIEIDQRAVKVLGEKLPQLHVIHQDVLTFDWRAHAEKVGGKIMIVANLPYHIVSQVLFSLADASDVIAGAVVTMQYEVAERITANSANKDYGIPSVVFQLYGKTKLLFKIPPTVFYPVPKVDSALISVDFTKPSPLIVNRRINMERLRLVVSTAFRQRRKMMRQSLRAMLQAEWAKKIEKDLNGVTDDDLNYGDQGLLRPDLPSPWDELRPEQLTPEQFVELTVLLFGELTEEQAKKQQEVRAAQRIEEARRLSEDADDDENEDGVKPVPVTGTWRRSKAKAALLASPSNSERKKIKRHLDELQSGSSPATST